MFIPASSSLSQPHLSLLLLASLPITLPVQTYQPLYQLPAIQLPAIQLVPSQPQGRMARELLPLKQIMAIRVPVNLLLSLELLTLAQRTASRKPVRLLSRAQRTLEVLMPVSLLVRVIRPALATRSSLESVIFMHRSSITTVLSSRIKRSQAYRR